MTKAEMARQIILSTKGRIFGATVRKIDGTIREFNAKTYEDSNNPVDALHGNMKVIENNAIHKGNGRYRTIKLENVLAIRVSGQEFRFAD